MKLYLLAAAALNLICGQDVVLAPHQVQVFYHSGQWLDWAMAMLLWQFMIFDRCQGLADAGDGNSRKETKTSHNGLPSHPLNQPKRSRTSTPTPAPKIARIEGSRPSPQLPVRVVTPPSQTSLAEEDDQPIVEVDPTEVGMKQEGWMMGSGGDDSNDYEIPSEQFEQDMQAEDEQYIQAGNDALSGQQVDTHSVT